MKQPRYIVFGPPPTKAKLLASWAASPVYDEEIRTWLFDSDGQLIREPSANVTRPLSPLLMQEPTNKIYENDIFVNESYDVFHEERLSNREANKDSMGEPSQGKLPRYQRPIVVN